MAVPTEQDLGAFAAGEVPPPLTVTYRDFDNNVVDISGMSQHQVNIDEELDSNSNPLGTGVVSFETDGTDGKVTYTWVRDDMIDVGEYTCQVWVNNGANYFASDLYRYSVYDGPGDPPT